MKRPQTTPVPLLSDKYLAEHRRDLLAGKRMPGGELAGAYWRRKP